MNKTICIVPFTKKEYALADNLSRTYSSMSFVSPKGVGMMGEDISIMKNTYKTGYRFTNLISDGVVHSDAVLITDIKKEQKSLYAFALRALRESIAAGKEIICFLELDDNELNLYQGQCREKDIAYYFYRNPSQDDYAESDEEEEFRSFHIPVIYISEMIPDCEGYDVFLKLVNQLQSDGKRVLAISQDAYNILVEQVHMTFWSKTDSRKMVYRINHAVYDLIRSKRPDILVIRLPEPMMKYDDENTYDFGLTAFLLAQAIPGDGCIFCTYAGTPPVDFWSSLNRSVMYKFGYPIYGVHVSNQIIDTTEDRWISAFYIPVSEVEQELNIFNQHNDFGFYHLLKQEEFDRLYETLNNELFEIPYGVVEV